MGTHTYFEVATGTQMLALTTLNLSISPFKITWIQTVAKLSNGCTPSSLIHQKQFVFNYLIKKAVKESPCSLCDERSGAAFNIFKVKT